MNKQLLTLSVLLLAAIGVCVWLLQQPSDSEFESELLFTDLKPVAADIDSVIIENNSGILFKGLKSDDNWFAELGYSGQLYPVDKQQLANLINSLIQAKLVEAKTKLKENHQRLGLQSIAQEDSLARLVTIGVGNKSWQVLIGNQVNFGEGSYVRLPQQNQSWRLDKDISLPIDQFSWFQRPILPYTNEDIVSVSRVDDEHNWEMEYNEQTTEFVLDSLPAGRTLQYEGVLSSFVSTLMSTDFEEIIIAEETFIQTLETVTELNVMTKQNGSFNVFLTKAKGVYYLNFTTDNGNEYWQTHYYQVSDFAAQQLNKQLTDFFAEPDDIDDSTSEQNIEEGAPEN